MHVRIALAADPLDPAADRVDRELGRVAGDAETDPASIGAHIVHAVRHDLAQLLVDKIMRVDAMRIALGPIIAAAVLEVADQLLLLRIFFASTEITSCPAACAATAFVLICSNCALRSG